MVNVVHIAPVNDAFMHTVKNGCVLCECDPFIRTMFAGTPGNKYDEDAFMVTHIALDPGGIKQWLSIVPEELIP